MAAITSAQAGNWSATATWTGGVVPTTGDTVTIAHAVTLDQDVTIGTSPNDTTTNVLTINSSITFTLGTGRSLTLRGNIGQNSNCALVMQAGSSITFDNSSSGGSPSYGFNGANVYYLTVNGTSGSRCSISAIAGQTFRFSVAWWNSQVTYCDITRAAASTLNMFDGNTHNWSYVTWTSCGLIELSNTAPRNITRCIWLSTTGSSGSVKLNNTGSSLKTFTLCSVDKLVTHIGSSWTVANCVFAGGVSTSAGASGVFRSNFVSQDGSLNGGNGARFDMSPLRCYFVVQNETGNPHFIQPMALAGSTSVQQCVFESQSPDLIDTGDCVLLIGANFSGANTATVRNNIVLRSGYSGATVSSGCLITSYSDSVATEHILADHNTANIDDSVLPAVLKRGSIAVAEAADGAANQVSSLKSNVFFGTTGTQGYVAERIQGAVDGIIKPSGADYNCRHNLSAGNNGRGYHDRANSPGQDLWTTGNADGSDASAAGVDNNQIVADPQFYDSARNVAAWSVARGYGSGYAAGVTALQADPSRVVDLINYIFEGYSPTNSTLRTAAHDGGCVGAANFRRSRNLSFLSSREQAFNAL